ncbi:MAG: NADH-quinone oxidoreductase subunit L, partial [Firmicutes bacterium]|nr:NADH-quinone oxidoreductase subunit L [Bacillota bacterium]
KSAQFPLHVWLPDAMAGPTPGSALIHAATMVAAGVYLVARAYGIFVATPYALFWVALIGGFTALFAATIATVMTDIKKVLAYSTVSQLGYMMLGLGAGSYTAGIFHLMTHAFFKSLLFLGSGSVIHAVHSQEMHEMGGLRKKLPITYWTFLIGTAALAGIPPFSGFWSKDEILLAAYRSPYPVLFWMGVATAGLTAYYMTRAVILTFFGQPRDHHKYEHAHESPPVMTVPLVILATLAAVSGLPGSPFLHNAFGEFVKFGHGHEAEPSSFVMIIAISAALLGVLAGVAIYGYKVISREKAIRSWRPLYLVLKNKYYVDEFYMAIFVRGTVLLAEIVGFFDRYIIDGLVNLVGWLGMQLSFLSGLFDKYVIDGMVNGVAAITMALGNSARRLQTGFVQSYAITLFAGVVIGLILIQLIGG